jgi:hypothetical protein
MWRVLPVLVVVGCAGKDAGVSADAAVADAAMADGAVAVVDGRADGPVADAHAGDAPPVDAHAADAPPVDAVPIDAPPPDDPFDPGSCPGTPITMAEAAARIGASDRVALATATLMVHHRTCPDDAGTCAAWDAAMPYTQTLVTYSGGVTTHSKTFSFPMTLVLWNHSGTDGFTVRQSDDYANSPMDDTRGVVFPLAPAMVQNPTIWVWDPAPSHPEDYQDLYTYFAGPAALTATAHCARFTITIPADRPVTELAALFRF